MRCYKIFSKLRGTTIEKLFKSMERYKFFRGQKVYIEGKSKVDGVYFIKEGEFELTQKRINDE